MCSSKQGIVKQMGNWPLSGFLKIFVYEHEHEQDAQQNEWYNPYQFEI